MLYYCGNSLGQRLTSKCSEGMKLIFSRKKYVVKFLDSKFISTLLMMEIQKITDSQHESRVFHVLVSILHVQSQDSVNPSSAHPRGKNSIKQT